MRRNIAIWGAAVLVAWMFAAPARADLAARRISDAKWRELAGEYAADHPAVTLEHTVNVDVSVKTGRRGLITTTTRESMYIAVFDAHRAEGVLEQVFFIPPGVSIKSLKAWSREQGSEDVHWARDVDFYKRKLFGSWKEIRVSIPGLSARGLCGVEIETKTDGLAISGQDFSSSTPVLAAEMTLTMVNQPPTELEEYERTLERWYFMLARGNFEHEPLHLSPDGLAMTWKIENIPPRTNEPLVPARERDQAEVFMTPQYFKWGPIVENMVEQMEELEPPEDLVEAARDTLEGASDAEKVAAVARYLDDPRVFRILGGDRSGQFRVRKLARIVKNGEGSPFDKVLLARAILAGLGVESHPVLAASRYETDLDWRLCHPSRLNAALLWVPSVSDDFLWDVAHRSVPLGKAGYDLYPEMVVVQADRLEPLESFYLEPDEVVEARRMELDLAEDGTLEGPLSLCFSGWPSYDELDPWVPDQDLEAVLDDALPLGASVTDARWETRGSADLRCTRESPATLRCRLTAEADPVEERAWQIQPLFWSLPRRLAALADDEREKPAFLDCRYEFCDSVIVHLGDRRIVDIPPRERMSNRAGAFECQWQEAGETLVIERKIILTSAVSRDERIQALGDLCRAWNQSRGFAVLVE